MKRFLLSIVTLLILSAAADAAHIKGGFFTYKYLGPGSGTNLRYQVTLTVYMICSAESNPGQLSNPINFSIYNTATNQFVQNASVSISNQYRLSKVFDEPCIDGDQTGCYYYIVIYDLPSVELPAIAGGYTIAYQRCCRIAGINNVVNSGNIGNTFSIKIPGTAGGTGFETNSSPVFPINDTVVVCANNPFSYSFQATDPNGDDLSYQFCDAIQGADQVNNSPATASAPPYSSVPYSGTFSGAQPMGVNVNINAATGLISGIAPAQDGEYVVSVCVSEFRNNVLIGITRKELHIQVKICDPLDAFLKPQPTTCDGFSVTFSNNPDAHNPAGTTYHWTFGEPSSGSLDTSFLEFPPPHTYAAAGTYFARLRVSIAGLCIDSADLTVNVFPGFFPGFTSAGGCFLNPYNFTDTTKTNYGFVDSWSWNFGDETTLADTSHVQHPSWTYSTPGIKTVTLTVSNSKGCSNTISFPSNVLDKPLITLGFTDTLICIPDAVTLNASGTGTFNWTPLTNITNANTATPTVNPTTTTTYTAHLNDNGCSNDASVRVRVVPNVTLVAMRDTTICFTDAVRLTANTDGLSFLWSPAATLDNPAILSPTATPVATSTTYQIRATIGSCSATDDVTVLTVPYPVADAGAPQTICYNATTQLHGSHDGSSFTWTPTSYLSNPNILNPFTSPPRTTSYVLTVFDTKGCPKPGRDTVVITMLPRVRAYAGRDTLVIVGQPLQFNGSGGLNYTWSPATGLSSTTIFNPIGVYTAEIDSIRYKLIVTDAAGCADSAFVKVTVFKTKPSIFVPTAFTPNNNGKNDTFYPVSVGIQRINYFSVFNRWGQLVFKTTKDRDGWDGRIKGQTQDTGVYVWMVSAVDYLGKTIFLKGTVTLIR